MIYIDLSGWIENGMWQSTSNYPGATITQIPQPPADEGEPPCYNQQFVLSCQSGTYVENEAHVDCSVPGATACLIEDFVMEAVILRLARKDKNEPILADELGALDIDIPPDSAVLLATGWDRHWHESQAFVEGSPFITADAARWIFTKQPRMLGADIPRFDYPAEPCFPWDEFWEKVPYLIAPVTNILEQIFTRGRLVCFPLKIRGAMGSPVRAVLEVDE